MKCFKVQRTYFTGKCDKKHYQHIIIIIIIIITVVIIIVIIIIIIKIEKKTNPLFPT